MQYWVLCKKWTENAADKPFIHYFSSERVLLARRRGDPNYRNLHPAETAYVFGSQEQATRFLEKEQRDPVLMDGPYDFDQPYYQPMLITDAILQSLKTVSNQGGVYDFVEY